MNPETFDDIVSRIYEADSRFDPDAYYYLRDAIDRTAQKLGRSGPKAENHHVSGKELSEGFRDCMLEDFGPMAATLAEEWGLGQSEDIGAMVYNLIEAGAFGKAPQDRRSDFNGVFNLLEALERPYRPRNIRKFREFRDLLKLLHPTTEKKSSRRSKRTPPPEKE